MLLPIQNGDDAREFCKRLDSLIDLESNMKVEVGRSPELRIGWANAVLDSAVLDRVVVAFVTLPQPDERSKHEPFNHYLKSPKAD
jgi:hypothetical protein